MEKDIHRWIYPKRKKYSKTKRRKLLRERKEKKGKR